MQETIRGGMGAPKAVPSGAGGAVPPAKAPEAVKGSEAAPDVRHTPVGAGTKQEPPPPVIERRVVEKPGTVVTPYGSVLVGMNSLVVTVNGVNIPMPIPVAEALFGSKQGG